MTKSRKMRKGGFWDSVTSGWGSMTQGATSGWNSVSESASSFWGPKKNTSSSSSTTSTYTPSSTTSTSTSTYTPSSSTSTYTPSTTTSTPSTTGGSRKRRMRGGCNGKSLADHAAPYHGSSTAQAKWVGGKRTRRHKKKRSTRRHK